MAWSNVNYEISYNLQLAVFLITQLDFDKLCNEPFLSTGALLGAFTNTWI